MMSCRPCNCPGCNGRCSMPTTTCRTTAAAFGAPPVFCPSDLRGSRPTWRAFLSPSRADLREHYPFGMFAVPRERSRGMHASSGTTGKPTVVGYTRATSTPGPTWSWPARSVAAGGRPGDVVHNAYGYGLFTGGLGAHYGAEHLGLHRRSPMSGGQTERQVQLIRDFEPDVIMVTPSYMLALLDELRARRASTRARVSLAARSASSAPSRGRNAMRTEIECQSRHRRRRHLRSVGGDGPRRGQRVRRDQGRAAHLGRTISYPEIIDPVSGEVLPDGSRRASWCSPR